MIHEDKLYNVKMIWFQPGSSDVFFSYLSVQPLGLLDALKLKNSYIPDDDLIIKSLHQNQVVDWSEYVNDVAGLL